jgi:type II restriction enzyme
MKKLCQLLNKSEDELFEYIINSFKRKITEWSYFVNWKKVFNNVEPFEKELNLLNYLIGKQNIKTEIQELISEYPQVIKVIPLLLAIRDNSLEVLIDTKNFIYREFDFTKQKLTKEDIISFSEFIMECGFGELLRQKKIKNLVDYTTGVEVGLDSNGRKNRGGSLMELLVEEFILEATKDLNIDYISQATEKKIKEKWDVSIQVDKSSRIVDFAINNNGQIYFIEVNFYGGGGSKLKSTATEYIKMDEYWNNQGIEFIWITDGAGWHSTLKPLREYFDKANYLLNLEMLKEGILGKIL